MVPSAGLFRAIGAEAADLDRHFLGGKIVIVAPVGQALIDVRIRKFLHEAATIADGKGRHVMPLVGMLAGHIGIEAFEPVGKPFLDQLVQGTVDGRRRDGPFAPHLVENLVGRERVLG